MYVQSFACCFFGLLPSVVVALVAVSRSKSVLVISSVWFQLPQLSSTRNNVSISVLAVSLLRAQHSSFYSYCIFQFQPAPSTLPINCFPFFFISPCGFVELELLQALRSAYGSNKILL